MAITLFRSRIKEDLYDDMEKSIAGAMAEVGFSSTPEEQIENDTDNTSITERHRSLIEQGSVNLQNLLIKNNDEMERITVEYNKVMNQLRSDNDEYNLSLKALNASLTVYADAEQTRKKTTVKVLPMERAIAEGYTLEKLKEMWDQAKSDSTADPFGAFADMLGWTRADAKSLFLSVTRSKDATGNV